MNLKKLTALLCLGLVMCSIYSCKKDRGCNCDMVYQEKSSATDQKWAEIDRHPDQDYCKDTVLIHTEWINHMGDPGEERQFVECK